MNRATQANPQTLLSLGIAGPRVVFGGFVRQMKHWSERRRSRAALARIDDHLLRDVGLDALSVEQEAAKPFWS